MSFANWLSENLRRAEDAVLEGGLSFLLDMCKKFDTSVVPSRLETNGGWISLGRAQATRDRDKSGYVANFGVGSSGVPYCSVTFRCYQGGGTTEYWSSKDVVWDLYRADSGFEVLPGSCVGVDDEGLRRLQREDEERKQVEKVQLEQRKAANLAYELEMFRLWPSVPMGSQAGYFEGKNILNFVQELGVVKYSSDKYGEFGAIQLVDARDGEPVGLQKFYDREVFSKDGGLIGNKRFSWGLCGDKMKHACHVIGSINNYGTVAVCEGFADGVVIHAATGLPVVVALNKNNIGSVVAAIRRSNPLVKFRFCADNDDGKYDHADNGGVLACLYAARKYGGRVALPVVGKDFGDMFESLLPKAVIDTFLYRYVRAGIRDGEIEPNRKAIAKLEYYEGIRIGARLAIEIFDALQIEGVVKIWAKLPTPLKQIKTAINKAKSPADGLAWCLNLFNLTGLRQNFSDSQDETVQLKKVLNQSIYAAAHLTPATPANNVKTPIYAAVLALPTRIPEITNQQVNSLIKFVDERFHKFSENNIVEAKRPLSAEILSHHQTEYSNVPDYKNDDVAERIIDADKGVFVVVSTHGTGKTSVIGKGCVEKARENGQKTVYVSHRVTLSRDASTVLSIANYQDVNQEDVGNLKELSICVNSIINEKFHGFIGDSKVLLLDEVSQVYRHLAVGSVPDHLRMVIYKKMQNLIRSADKVVATDADIDDLTIHQLQLARPNEKFHIHINTHRKGVNQKIFVHTHEGGLVESMQAALKCGRNVFAVSDSRKVVESFEHVAIRALSEDEHFACITSGNTKDTENSSLIRDINGELSRFKHRFFAASPAISSGVSIVTPHFNQHFGFFYGQVTPKDAWQQLRRDRTAKSYHVFLSSKNQQFETNVGVLREQIGVANSRTRVILGLDEEVEEEDYKYGDFDQLRLAIMVQDNADRNDFASRFLRLAQFDGVQVEYVDGDGDEKLMREFKDLARAKNMEAIMKPKMIVDDEQAERLLRLNDRTSSQTYALTNWLIRDCFAVENVTEDDVNFWDDGRGWKQLKLLELAISSRDTILDFERLEQENSDFAITTRSFSILKRGYLRYILEFIGAKIGESGIDFSGVRYTSEDLRGEFIQKLIAEKDEFNACRLGTKVSEKTILRANYVVRSVLGNMGIYLKRRQLRINKRRHYVYTVDLERSRYVLDALARRQKAGKNFFEAVVAKAAEEKVRLVEAQQGQVETNAFKIVRWLSEQKYGVVFKVRFLARQLGLHVEVALDAVIDLFSEGKVKFIDDGVEKYGKVVLA